MTIQQLRYIITVAEAGSITDAARSLFLSQPSLSAAIKDIEKETGLTIFIRSRSGVKLTQEGMEFLGYARQVLQQMELLEDKYISKLPEKTRFGVSTQHYTFAENAFVNLVRSFGQERFEFYYNEAGTHQILEDVRNRVSDLGIIFLSRENRAVLIKDIDDSGLQFTPLFSAKPHVFLRREHPLAAKDSIRLEELQPFPRLNFVQGMYESAFYSEELFSSIPSDKEIRINDRGAIVNFMLGLDAYTISSGIYPDYLHGDSIISVPLDADEEMLLGYVTVAKRELGELGRIYIDEIKKYDPALKE